MSTWYMTASNGKVSVYPKISQEGPSSFESDDLDAVAAFVVENDIDRHGWMNSSSMDFGTEYGFNFDNLRGEIWAKALELRDKKDQDKKPHRIRIVFGEEAVRKHVDGLNDVAKLSELGSVDDFAFATQAELDAFCQGLAAAVGWMECTAWDPEQHETEEIEDE